MIEIDGATEAAQGCVLVAELVVEHADQVQGVHVVGVGFEDANVEGERLAEVPLPVEVGGEIEDGVEVARTER